MADVLRTVLTEAWKQHLSSAPAGRRAPPKSTGRCRCGGTGCRDPVTSAGPRPATSTSTWPWSVAGFTGLWTALLPGRGRSRGCGSRCVEREVAGFGASGRNGGWCSALFAASAARLDREHGPGAGAGHAPGHGGRPSTRSGRAAASEGIDCGFAKGGTVVLARNAGPGGRGPAHEVAEARAPRHRARTTSACCRPAEARRRVAGPRLARRHLHPALRRRRPGPTGPGPGRGGRAPRGHHLFERTEVTPIRPAGAGERPAVRTRGGPCVPTWWCGPPRGTPDACPGEERTLVPVYSLMIATEPLPDDVLGGGRAGPAGDLRRPPPPDHLRAADGRRPDGLRRPGRPVPLRLGHPARRSTATGLGARGPAADAGRPVPRPRPAPPSPTVGRAARDRHATGSPRSASTADRPGLGRRLRGRRGVHHQPGRADPARPDPRARHASSSRLPWVGHRSTRWEPEPLRWLGINAGLWTMAAPTGSSSGRRGRRAWPRGWAGSSGTEGPPTGRPGEPGRRNGAAPAATGRSRGGRRRLLSGHADRPSPSRRQLLRGGRGPGPGPPPPCRPRDGGHRAGGGLFGRRRCGTGAGASAPAVRSSRRAPAAPRTCRRAPTRCPRSITSSC